MRGVVRGGSTEPPPGRGPGYLVFRSRGVEIRNGYGGDGGGMTISLAQDVIRW